MSRYSIKALLDKLLKPNGVKRVSLFLTGDLAVFIISFYLSTLVTNWSLNRNGVVLFFAFSLPAKILCNHIFRLYKVYWRFVSIGEAIGTIKATTISSGFLVLLSFAVRTFPPPQLIFVDYLLTLSGVMTVRMMKRFYLHIFRNQDFSSSTRVLLVGGGELAEVVARKIANGVLDHYVPVGIIEDDPSKRGTYLHGIRVLGARDRMERIIKEYEVEEVLITNPNIGPDVIHDVIERARRAGLKSIKILPGLRYITSGKLIPSEIRDIQVEDLLGREPAKVDMALIERFVKGKSIMVTGAAGSIGSELCEQLSQFDPGILILLEQDETELYALRESLNAKHPDLRLQAVVGDIRDRDKMCVVMKRWKPDIMFHAAAYKHVPIMEENPSEAVKTNVFGTMNVAQAALEAGVEKFVLISTDKAVKPSSVMGATKRVAEMLLNLYNHGKGKTKFIAVRFGNVLGSRGSVIPIFEEQIRRGGPVTVTHPDMTRYFMTIPEAVSLILQAGAMGQGGEIFILDMGSPMRILNLAREMIRLSGYEPEKDIPIIFTGIRPGEKLHEELVTAEEGSCMTRHERIFVAKMNSDFEPDTFFRTLERLRKAAQTDNNDEVIGHLMQLVPSYQPARGGER
jgi:FlaA1/EpsC-like NDP-sugar epimerase